MGINFSYVGRISNHIVLDVCQSIRLIPSNHVEAADYGAFSYEDFDLTLQTQRKDDSKWEPKMYRARPNCVRK
jgi:hypothetical protein